MTSLPGKHDEECDELLRRCQRGDETALNALVRRFQERIFRLAWRICGDASLAEEATAQALVKIWSRSGQWSGKAGATTWILRLATHTVLDVVRGQRRWWRRASGPMPQVEQRAEDSLERSEEQRHLAEKLQRGVAELSEADRALVHLYYHEDKSLAEIEAILGVSRETLKMRLARARQKLKVVLDDERPCG